MATRDGFRLPRRSRQPLPLSSDPSRPPDLSMIPQPQDRLGPGSVLSGWYDNCEPDRERDMTIEELEPNKPGRLAGVVRRISGSARSARNGAAGVIGRLPATITATRNGVRKLLRRVPATIEATQAGALATTSALQQLPDSTLQSLAASSAGLGAGLYLAGRRRLAVVAGVIPALIVGVAIAVRPVKKAAPAKSNP